MSKKTGHGRNRDVQALIEYLNDRVAMPHAWGRRANDCIAFLAGAVKAQTGRTHLGDLTWSNRSQALRVLKREGGIEAALDKRFKRIAPAQAMRGDIAGVPTALLDLDATEAAALLGFHPYLVEGATLVAPGPHGLRRLPRSAMMAAWSITDKPDVAK